MPSWRDPPPPAAAPTPPAPAGWRVGPAARPYRPRWPWVGGAALGALAVLGAVVWVALWNRPTPPARVVVLHAGYSANLAVPPNPHGANLAAALSASPSRLTRAAPLLPELDGGRDRVVVVVVAAHGGRDRDGAFLFPDDADTSPASRVRLRALIDRLAALPAKRQKFLILDATEPPAYPDHGLVHNDFAAAAEELNDAIAAVPNLAVLVSSGLDQRSWPFPESGLTAFGHHVQTALAGAADLDGDRHVTGWELAAFTTSRVKAWARDQRAALQEPILLPRGSEGEARTRAMHLVAVRPVPVSPPEPPAPFEPPPELKQTWETYRTLATATPPPEAYTPQEWRQFEAWALRHERHVLANDAAGAATARGKLDDLRRRIEAERHLPVRPQTLALPEPAGHGPSTDPIPPAFAIGIAQVAATGLSDADRRKEWDQVRAAVAADPEAAKVLWAAAFVRHVAADPVGRLDLVPQVLPLLDPLFPVRPAELHFLAMLAAHRPPFDPTSAYGPLVKRVLTLRLTAERVAAGGAYGEEVREVVADTAITGDAARRQAEDLCFSADPADWAKAARFAAEAEVVYARIAAVAERVRAARRARDAAAARMPALAEWLVRTPPAADRRARDAAFRDDLAAWASFHGGPAGTPLPALDQRLAREADRLVAAKPEFEGVVTPRADAVAWWHAADAVLTAPDLDPARRVNLLREYRRVSRQLVVTSRAKPEALPEVSAADARDRAFDAARRRGAAVLARLGKGGFPAAGADSFDAVAFRLGEFAFAADPRAALVVPEGQFGNALRAADRAAANDQTAARLLPPAVTLRDNPAATLRRTQLRALLLAQADRTVADHWYADGNDPYFRRAADQLVADAARLSPAAAPVPPGRTTEAFPVRADLPAKVVFTDEPAAKVRAAFAKVAGVSGRPGYVALRADPPFGGAVVRRAVPTETPPPLDFALPPSDAATTPVVQSGLLRLTGFFRGRVAEQTTTVERHPVPHHTAATVPPIDPYAKLAVRADPSVAARFAAGAGSVLVVLDCSGSMRPDPAAPGSRGLYPVAVAALRDVLNEVPGGVTVGVTTFGRRTPGARTPEDTIRPFVPPAPLPVPPGAAATNIVARAAAVSVDDLYDRSPVVRSVRSARDALKQLPGPVKAVVLISDAVDTRFPEDAEFAKKTVADVLRESFAGGDVPLAVVALPVTAPEEVAAQKQFAVVTTLRPAGLFVPPERASEVGRWLRAAFAPRVRVAVDPLDAAAVPPFDLTAPTGPPDDWFPGKLPAGRYRLRVPVADFAAELSVRPGDRLLMDLAPEGDRLALRRHWFPASWPALARSDGPGPRVAVLQNRPDGPTVRIVAAVEPPPGIAVEAVPPGEAWFDIVPQTPKTGPVAVRWRVAPGFPGPAWAVDVAGWPAVPGGKGLAAPAVRVWWAAAFAPAGEPWPRPPTGWTSVGETKLAGGAVTVRSVAIETHRVEVRAGVFEPRACLAVRLDHPPGKPAWVRPIPAATGGEVRAFAAADRVTCLFWWDAAPLTPADADARVTAFEVVAKPAGGGIDVPGVPPPSESSPVADPPAGR